jgi:hypothetical protein
MSLGKNETDEEILYLTAKFYMESDKLVHVTYKDGTWNNGKIIDVKLEFFMLNDLEDGLMPVFYIKTKYIREYKKEEGENVK